MFALRIGRIVARLLVVFYIVVLVILGINDLGYSNVFFDPFAPYDDLAPGTPLSQLGNYSCREKPALTYIELPCQITLPSDFFENIHLRVQGGRIISVIFLGGSLRIADVVLRWGQPQTIYKRPWGVLLHWDRGVTAAIPGNSRNFYWRLVQYVRLEL